MRTSALACVAALASTALAPSAAAAGDFSFTTSADFVRVCDGVSPSEECLNAIMHVEQVVDDTDHPNGTCDGGPDELLKSSSNDELDGKLAERLARVVPWLKAHPEYDALSYGDGVWAALKGAYCP
jgi:hypothetical protein